MKLFNYVLAIIILGLSCSFLTCYGYSHATCRSNNGDYRYTCCYNACGIWASPLWVLTGSYGRCIDVSSDPNGSCKQSGEVYGSGEHLDTDCQYAVNSAHVSKKYSFCAVKSSD